MQIFIANYAFTADVDAMNDDPDKDNTTETMAYPCVSSVSLSGSSEWVALTKADVEKDWRESSDADDNTTNCSWAEQEATHADMRVFNLYDCDDYTVAVLVIRRMEIAP